MLEAFAQKEFHFIYFFNAISSIFLIITEMTQYENSKVELTWREVLSAEILVCGVILALIATAYLGNEYIGLYTILQRKGVNNASSSGQTLHEKSVM